MRKAHCTAPELRSNAKLNSKVNPDFPKRRPRIKDIYRKNVIALALMIAAMFTINRIQKSLTASLVPDVRAVPVIWESVETEVSQRQLDQDFIEEDRANFKSIAMEEVEIARAEQEALEQAKREETERLIEQQIEKEAALKQVRDDEALLLAKIMMAELGVIYSQDHKNAERVFKLGGSVLINRANDPAFAGNSISSVLHAGGYASITITRVSGYTRKDIPDEVLAWAEELLAFGPIPDIVYQANFKQGEVMVTYANGGWTEYFGKKSKSGTFDSEDMEIISP